MATTKTLNSMHEAIVKKKIIRSVIVLQNYTTNSSYSCIYVAIMATPIWKLYYSYRLVSVKY